MRGVPHFITGSRLYRHIAVSQVCDAAARPTYRHLRYPLPPIDFGSVRILRTYCLFIDLTINNSFVFKHPLSGPNMHSVLSQALTCFLWSDQGLIRPQNRHQGLKRLCRKSEGPPRMASLSFPLFLFYRIQRNFMPSMFPGKSSGMNRLQLACKKNA